MLTGQVLVNQVLFGQVFLSLACAARVPPSAEFFEITPEDSTAAPASRSRGYGHFKLKETNSSRRMHLLAGTL